MVIRYRRLCLAVMSLCFALPTFATQLKLATDNKTVEAKISAKELTRIFVDGDRIVQVRGVEGAYTLNKDNSQGAIYIQPTPAYRARAFNIFITTEQGHTYPLFLLPLDVPSETIRLKPITAANAAAEHWETNSSYEQTLVDLITAMVNRARPEGFAVVDVSKVLPSQTGVLKVYLKTAYLGKRLRGEILHIFNKSNSTVHLAERQFYTANTRALALFDQDIAPQQSTYLYRVVNNE